ncbi:uncharacterized protein LOC120333853 [Styela clava]
MFILSPIFQLHNLKLGLKGKKEEKENLYRHMISTRLMVESQLTDVNGKGFAKIKDNKTDGDLVKTNRCKLTENIRRIQNEFLKRNGNCSVSFVPGQSYNWIGWTEKKTHDATMTTFLRTI